jgi:uncharacterized protein (DUF58 family)
VTARRRALDGAFVTVVAWLLVLGVSTARIELLLATLPLVAALTAARLWKPVGAADYEIVHEVPTRRVFEGDPVTVSLTITARRCIPLLEVVEPVPPLTRASGPQPPRWLLTLSAGETVRRTHEMRPTCRQRLALGTVQVRQWEPAGLRVQDMQHREPKIVAVYPRVEPLRRLPSPQRTQPHVGNYVSGTLGEGIEPGDVRPFAPGDRIRQVNWRASLRRDALHVTQRLRERNADVVLMLDTLAAVGPPGDTTLDAAVRAAASLAAAYLARKDRVGLIEYGGLVRWVKPGTGQPHAVRLLDALLGSSVLFTYVAKDLALVPPRVLPAQALVIALTSLLDPRFTKAVLDLAARRFDVIVLAVSPLPAARAVRPATAGLDLAARLWALERAVELDALRAHRLSVVEWDPVQPLAPAVAAFGRRRPPLGIAA